MATDRHATRAYAARRAAGCRATCCAGSRSRLLTLCPGDDRRLRDHEHPARQSCRGPARRRWRRRRQWRAEEERMGLDKPLPERYWNFVSGAVQGDFGTSFKTERPVATDLGRSPAGDARAGARWPRCSRCGSASRWASSPPRGATRRSTTPRATARDGRGGDADLLARPRARVRVLLPARLDARAPSGAARRSPRTPPPNVTGFLTIDSLLAGDIGALWTALQYLALPALTLAIIELAPIIKMSRSAMLETLRHGLRADIARARLQPAPDLLRRRAAQRADPGADAASGSCSATSSPAT